MHVFNKDYFMLLDIKQTIIPSLILLSPSSCIIQCTYIHTYIHTYTHTYIHTYTHTHTYIYTYIHTYMYIN